jgi:hypothetical protein
MNTNLTTDATQAAANEEASRSTWRVVSQVKSNRVVYFTDDPDYAPPTEGDWYYISPYQGDLPKAMTLRNCWGWRFNGMAFTDARELNKPNLAQTLLSNNKEALHKLLRDKIDAARKPFVATSPAADALHQLRLQQARSILGAQKIADSASEKLLLCSAAARGISLQDMAQRTLAAHEAAQTALIDSEVLRDEIAVAIDKATDQQQLMLIRQRLMNDLAPQLNENFKIKPAHTTAQQQNAKATPDQLAQEQLRLTVQLRLKINNLRRPHVSDYILDDVVLKHKGQIAQAVLNNAGQVPQQIDATALMSHAAARGQTLVQAAKDVLTEMNETAKVLLDTEQLKEVMLSRISSVSSFKDIEAASTMISALVLPVATAQTTQAQIAPASTTPPAIKPAKAVNHQDAAAMKSIRDAVVRASRLNAEISSIPKVGALVSADFFQLAKSGAPFIVQGMVGNWAISALTPDTLKDRFANLSVHARTVDYVEKAFTKKRQQQQMTMAEYFELLACDTSDLPPYLGNQSLPALTELCQWPDDFQTWAEPKIWLGPAGTITPLHCDYDDNLFAQVLGKKRFVLYPPHHADLLYLRQANTALFGSSFDPDAPDYDAFPLAKQAQKIECVLQPGDLLYLPAGWFHHVLALDFSLSANRWSRGRPLAIVSHNVNL